jgi:sialic acid synthase SpsE
MTEEKKIERHSGRSLFAAKSIRKGEFFTAENIRSVRPNIGLHTKYYEEIIGKKALQDIEFAEPIKEGMIEW